MKLTLVEGGFTEEEHEYIATGVFIHDKGVSEGSIQVAHKETGTYQVSGIVFRDRYIESAKSTLASAAAKQGLCA